jgi:hypothetical protein
MKLAKASALALALVMIGSSTAAFVAAFDPTDPLDALRDPDGDGLTNIEEFNRGTDPSNPDSDGGGTPDGWEVLNGLDPAYKLDDLADLDGDGWDSWTEFIHGTDPRNPDTDDDGIKDSLDPNPLYPDTDWFDADGGFANGDGGTESPVDGSFGSGGSGSGSGQGSGSGSGSGSGQGQGQGNGQGQGAGQGAGQGNGNGQGSGQNGGDNGQPSDSDGDGISDGEEDSNGNGQVDPGETDPFDPDTDHDGLRDNEERNVGLNPRNPDTDFDGLSDGSEVRIAHTDPLDRDTDDDLLLDAEETGPLAISDRAGTFCRPPQCDPAIASPNTMGAAGLNWRHFTDTSPLLFSTLGDGVSDAFADADDDGMENINELRTSYELPVPSGGTITVSGPYWGLSDPQEADTDCDLLLDGWETDPSSAPAGKSSGHYSNPAEVDTDGDGLADNVDPNPEVTTVLPPTRVSSVSVNGVTLNGVRTVSVVKQATITIQAVVEFQNLTTGSWYPVLGSEPMDVYIYLVQWNGSAWVPNQISTPIQTANGGFTTQVRITSDEIRAGVGYLALQTDIHNRDPTQVWYGTTQWQEPNSPAITFPPLAMCE